MQSPWKTWSRASLHLPECSSQNRHRMHHTAISLKSLTPLLRLVFETLSQSWKSIPMDESDKENERALAFSAPEPSLHSRRPRINPNLPRTLSLFTLLLDHPLPKGFPSLLPLLLVNTLKNHEYLIMIRTHNASFRSIALWTPHRVSWCQREAPEPEMDIDQENQAGSWWCKSFAKSKLSVQKCASRRLFLLLHAAPIVEDPAPPEPTSTTRYSTQASGCFIIIARRACGRRSTSQRRS